MALHANVNNVTYFNSFGAEHIPEEIKRFLHSKNVTEFREYKQMI